MSNYKRIFSLFGLAILLAPLAVAAVPVSASDNDEEIPQGWWTETTVDRNQNKIGDMVELHMDNPIFLDAQNTLPLIIDFYYTPGHDEIEMLEKNVDYQHQFILHGIDALAGRVPVTELLTLRDLPGVVMIELDGILTIANADARAGHGVDTAFLETGYDGSGSTVAIIDTGLDGNHTSLDDQDDDPTTYDPKIIGFYDPVNNPGNTNGTDFPYDDQGHGSHCGGTTAGTGAPTYDHPGMAPQAHLVGVKVLDAGGSGSFATVMAGMQWTIDTMHQYNTRAASMSLGGPGAIEWTSSEEDSVNRQANEMMRSGIALFIAAGNSAVSAQIGTPGSAEDAITVGALDKDTSIAIYSSQGPTEEGKIKPNIAYMGSNIMSVEANSIDQYVGFSGTSMATPGAAGVGALMLQANPDLSPFDIRNILQEQATYRQCHYMFANEACPEDLIPKNRQNNVYGHGHVNALESVLEAAEYNQVWSFNSNISLVLTNQLNSNRNVELGPGDSIVVELSQGVDTVQWMSNDLRDSWSNIHSYDHEMKVTLDYEDIVHELEHLPGIELLGNHTLSMRGIEGTSSSPLISIDIMLTDKSSVDESESSSSDLILYGSVIAAILLTIILVASILKSDQEKEINYDDSDIDEVVEAEIID
ncbi:MAG: S8 family serine peptidase [Candidatus Poseidoniales archaeon]|nr:S8 family serine peptidase [Candidatus Poseidoniales archaeon]|tara:strand:+ start:195 stop:2126 length:1932 start_codon:yes stop_codon:yes gene_type:complete